MFYSFNGDFPQELPSRWKFSDGTIHTNLSELDDLELEKLGWYGPIAMPPLEGTSYYTHRYEWDSDTKSFTPIELDIFEKEKAVNYTKFWDELTKNDTISWNKVKSTSRVDLSANTEMTEFISHIMDGKNGSLQKRHLQESLNSLFSVVTFTSEELQEFTEIFNSSGLNSIYTIPS